MILTSMAEWLEGWESRMRAHLSEHPDRECPRCGQNESGPYIEHYGACESCITAATQKQDLWDLAGLPAHAQHLAWGQFNQVPDNRDAIAAARSWEYGPQGLYLYGLQGRGKTELALCLAVAFIRSGQRAQFIDLQEFFKLLKESFNPGQRDLDPRHKLRPAEKVPLLVLDDIGVGAKAELAEATLGNLINARLNEGLPTIYTSNCAPKSKDRQAGFPTLVEAVGRRCASRIVGSTRALYVGGPDWRLQG